MSFLPDMVNRIFSLTSSKCDMTTSRSLAASYCTRRVEARLLQPLTAAAAAADDDAAIAVSSCSSPRTRTTLAVSVAAAQTSTDQVGLSLGPAKPPPPGNQLYSAPPRGR